MSMNIYFFVRIVGFEPTYSRTSLWRLNSTQLYPHLNKKKSELLTVRISLCNLNLVIFLYFRVRHSSEPWFCDQNLKDLLCLLKFLMISKFYILLFVYCILLFLLCLIFIYILLKKCHFFLFLRIFY